MTRNVMKWYLFILLLFQQAIAVKEVLFSPEDRPQKKLLTYLHEAKRKIYVAVYTFTDKDLAIALLDAKNRGVDVQLIVDISSVTSAYAKVFSIHPAVKIFVFETAQHHSQDPRARAFAPLMHNKYAIIDDMVWTGSFNWTQSANSRNQENIVVLKDASTRKKYEEHFKILLNKCTPLNNFTNDTKSIWKRTAKHIKPHHKRRCRSA